MKNYKDYYESEEYLEKVRKRQKVLRVVGIILVLLTVVYLIPGNVLTILEGQIVSEQLNEDFTINLDNGGKVIFKDQTYNTLLQLYLAEQEHEIKICLTGEKQDKDYLITGLYEPEVFSSSFAHVSAQFCNERTIIPLHSHPFKHCIFSHQDIVAYERFREINPDSITSLMCEPKRFNFYGV